MITASLTLPRNELAICIDVGTVPPWTCIVTGVELVKSPTVQVKVAIVSPMLRTSPMLIKQFVALVSLSHIPSTELPWMLVIDHSVVPNCETSYCKPIHAMPYPLSGEKS
ncbi:hypothetical protein SDC9_188434 [bioreactor metagenome]|uniref:Uncharacterized protein n=1 Tax=bioreactor metagenome TaxID=1076179 RepID=A0A645HXK0_9ZZZZ